MHTRLAAVIPLVSFLVACGQPSRQPAPLELAQLREQAAAVAAAIGSYRDQGAAMEGSAGCRAGREEYEARVGPALETLQSLARKVDPWLEARGPAGHADLECAVLALRTELERHTDIGCTSPDLVANRGETAAHVQVMSRWSDLLGSRIEEASLAGAGDEPRRGPRCVRFSDGSLMYMP
jgi:hypothetical protein